MAGRGSFHSTAEWLVDRAKKSLKHDDRYEAKSWLLTAKTLYPGNFHIQHEAYVIERNARNIREAAVLFHQMFEQFPNENLLWEDVFHITQALESEDLGQQGQFLKEMFTCLPENVQREMLLQTSGRCKDCIQKCCIMLLLLRRFPDAIPKNGITLTDILIDAETAEYPSSPVNPYRRLLVCDVLPHLLSSENVVVQLESEEQEGAGIPIQQIYKWLELCIQFYSFCATSSQGSQDSHMAASVGGTGPASNEAKDIIAYVQEGRGPWGAMYDIFCLIAKKCGWTELISVQEQLDPIIHRNIKERWTCISGIHHWLKKAAKHGTADKVINEVQEKAGVFYATIMIFIQSVWEYCRVVNRLDTSGNPCITSGSTLVLIEDVGVSSSDSSSSSADSSSAPKKKKKKTGTGPPSPTKEELRGKQSATVVVSKSCGSVSSSLPDDFVVAVDSWQILNTHLDYKNEFTRVLREWYLDQWLWMDSFKVDRLIYKAKYKKVVEFLKEQKNFLESDPTEHHELRVRGSLQLSCCYFYQTEYKSACAEALDALKIFSTLPAAGSADNKALKRGISVVQQGSSHRDVSSTGLSQHGSLGRLLQLIPCNEAEVLAFCVRLFITCLKQRIANESRAADLFGHVIVLLQYDWPREQTTFYELMEKIRSHGSFTYRCFFNYISNMDILEEFAHINNEGTLKLELLPKPSSNSRSRTVTRGVNKGAKEEFRSAMERQVLRSDENMEHVLLTFFDEQRDSILS